MEENLSFHVWIYLYELVYIKNDRLLGVVYDIDIIIFPFVSYKSAFPPKFPSYGVVKSRRRNF